MRSIGKRLGLGRLAYRWYYAPRALLRESILAGGPIEQWRTARGRAAMERAAFSLPRAERTNEAAAVTLHVLTGRRFWYQTAFCLWSFARQAQRPLTPVIYDDGTLMASPRDALARLFPSARFVTHAETLARLDVVLPAKRFPALRERWQHYPNIRKLINVHQGAKGWKLVVDSDLLFFRRPEFVLRWLDAPTQPLHAVDVETCYGYSPALLAELARAPVAERLNVGLCGLCSDELDWERIEHLCRALIEREGTHYYLEQAVVALLLAGRSCAVAPASDYLTLPPPAEAEACRAVMHHYVAGSKRWYFRHNWQRAVAAAP